jgi:glucan phosphoethanolaminetransferase (alkaline phosphatase superfamily)
LNKKGKYKITRIYIVLSVVLFIVILAFIVIASKFNKTEWGQITLAILGICFVVLIALIIFFVFLLNKGEIEQSLEIEQILPPDSNFV